MTKEQLYEADRIYNSIQNIDFVLESLNEKFVFIEGLRFQSVNPELLQDINNYAIKVLTEEKQKLQTEFDKL